MSKKTKFYIITDDEAKDTFTEEEISEHCFSFIDSGNYDDFEELWIVPCTFYDNKINEEKQNG